MKKSNSEVRKIFFLYKTPRTKIYKEWLKGLSPDTILYGANHFEKLGFKVFFSDFSYSPLNIFHWIFYPIQYVAAKRTGIGFKLDQALVHLLSFRKNSLIVSTMDTVGLPLLLLKKLKILKSTLIYISVGLADKIENNPRKWPFHWYKELLKHADIIICYSKPEERLLKQLNKNVYFLPVGIDFKFFQRKTKFKGPKSDKPVIIAFGRDQDRDYNTFITAIKGKNVKGIIVASRENLKGIAIPSNVKVYHDLPAAELKKKILLSDIVVIPIKKVKKAAGQLSLLDALACEKPVIISKIYSITESFGLKDYFHNLYYFPEKPESLWEKLEFLINNPNEARKIAANGQKLAKRYSTEAFANNLLEIINRVSE